MDGKKFAEIKKPVEEIRYLDNQEQEESKAKVIEKLEETVLPTAHALDENERFEEGFKDVIGGEIEAGCVLTPSVGVPAAGVSAIGGKITEGVGKLTDDEGTKAAGRVMKESGTKPLEDVGKGFKKAGEGIKKIFE
jgi:hypothetical protein